MGGLFSAVVAGVAVSTGQTVVGFNVPASSFYRGVFGVVKHRQQAIYPGGTACGNGGVALFLGQCGEPREAICSNVVCGVGVDGWVGHGSTATSGAC